MAVTRKVLALALASAAAVGFASSASAVTIIESGPVFGAFNIDPGAFTHTFYTAPPLSYADGTLSVGAQTTATVLLGSNDFDFAAVGGLQLHDLTTNTFVNGVLTMPGGPLGESEWILTANVLVGHTYNVIVNGFSHGPTSNFSGQLVYSAAVPEAATWMMMVAGFGLMGAAMRRRPRTQVTFA